MPKPPKYILYHFSNVAATLTLSNGIFSNSISLNLTTHPTQYSHLRYTYLIFVLILNRPTLRTYNIISLIVVRYNFPFN